MEMKTAGYGLEQENELTCHVPTGQEINKKPRHRSSHGGTAAVFNPSVQASNLSGAETFVAIAEAAAAPGAAGGAAFVGGHGPIVRDLILPLRGTRRLSACGKESRLTEAL